jgi:adenylylsulfate kinase
VSGTVVWVTGLPSSGKSTFASRAARRLAASGRSVLFLDGDEVRAALEPAPGYDRDGRDAFYRTLARLAGLAARQGMVAVVAATAPRRSHRSFAREVAPHLLEVFIDVPAAECARRDTKGLYARARAGEVESLPGVGEPYEPPISPDIVARGGEDEVALARLLECIPPQT